MKIPGKENMVTKSSHIVNLRCSVETKELDVDQRTQFAEIQAGRASHGDIEPKE